MEKKTIIAVLLCIGILFIWQEFFVEKPKIEPQQDAQAKTADSSKQEIEPEEGRKKEKNKTEKRVGNEERPEEKTVHYENELFEAVWSSRGASIRSFIVKGYKERVEGKKLKDSPPKDLVTQKSEKAQLFQVRFNQENTDFELPEFTDWSLVKDEGGEIIFRYIDEQDEQVPVITKTYTITEDPFVMDMEIELSNRSDESAREQLVMDVLADYQHVSTQQGGCMGGCAPASATSPRAPICRVNGSVEQLDPKPGMKQIWEPKVLWTGINEQFFLVSMVPMEVDKAVCMMEAEINGLMKSSLMYPEAVIPPGGSVSHKFKIFLGPKNIDLLEKVRGGSGQAQGDAKLSEAVDLGLLSVLGYPILWLLKAIYKLINNWGVAIIILTVIIKLLLMPLTQKMMKSQKQMGKLKPYMDELKKKYAEDKQKLNEETMKLFKANKVNPMSGCFPMLLQMPIWFALYRVLYSSVELYQTPFIIGWIDDLSYRDPYFIMPLVLGVSMFLQQRLSPTTMDTQQAKMMMYIMPVFFTFIMLYLPSGLVLYIFVNNILTIGHQVLYNRIMNTASPAEAKS